MRSKLLMTVFIATLVAPTMGFAVQAGDAAPSWSGRDLSGNTVEFPAIADGAPTVMLFWATWCPYCKAFIPQLEAIQNEYADVNVRVLAINFKEDGDVAAYINALGFPLQTIVDGDAIAAAYDVQFTPGIMVINGDSTVTFRRASTDLPAGITLAEMWAQQVRDALDAAL